MTTNDNEHDLEREYAGESFHLIYSFNPYRWPHRPEYEAKVVARPSGRELGTLEARGWRDLVAMATRDVEIGIAIADLMNRRSEYKPMDTTPSVGDV